MTGIHKSREGPAKQTDLAARLGPFRAAGGEQSAKRELPKVER